MNGSECGFRHYSTALQQKRFTQRNWLSPDNFISPIFSLYLYKFQACYFMGQWEWVHSSKECYLYLNILLWYFVVFHQKICFYHFHFIFFRYCQISETEYYVTNQKPESVIKNYLWNFIITTQSNDQWCFHFLKKFWNTVHYRP